MTTLELKRNIRMSTELLGNDETALNDVLNYIKNLLRNKGKSKENAFSELTGAWENDGKSVEEVMLDIKNARVNEETRQIESLD